MAPVVRLAAAQAPQRYSEPRASVGQPHTRPASPAPPTSCVAIYPERKLLEAQSDDGVRFYVNYDKLAVCTGSQVGKGEGERHNSSVHCAGTARPSVVVVVVPVSCVAPRSCCWTKLRLFCPLGPPRNQPTRAPLSAYPAWRSTPTSCGTCATPTAYAPSWSKTLRWRGCQVGGPGSFEDGQGWVWSAQGLSWCIVLGEARRGGAEPGSSRRGSAHMGLRQVCALRRRDSNGGRRRLVAFSRHAVRIQTSNGEPEPTADAVRRRRKLPTTIPLPNAAPLSLALATRFRSSLPSPALTPPPRQKLYN
jgi:hypothetical protein